MVSPTKNVHYTAKDEHFQNPISPESRQNKRRVANSMIYILLTTLPSAGEGTRTHTPHGTRS